MKKIVYVLINTIIVGSLLAACGESPRNEIDISPSSFQEEPEVVFVIEQEPDEEIELEQESDYEAEQGASLSEYSIKVSEKVAGHWWFGEGGFGFEFYSDGTAENFLGAVDWKDIEPRSSLKGTYIVSMVSSGLFRIEFEMNDEDNGIYEQLFGKSHEIQPFTYNYDKDELIFLGLDGIDRPPMKRLVIN